MRAGNSRLFFHSVVLVLGLFPLAACASWPERAALEPILQSEAQLVGYGPVRQWSDADYYAWSSWHDELFAQRAGSGLPRHLEMLAISSGADKGAYAAGFLKGWSESGNRPMFDVVSGVSTGALIAPFAFLGQGYDEHLINLFTKIDQDSIYRARPIDGLFGGPSLATTEPLAELIELYASEDLINRIATEHGKGRRLLIQTTNLDAERGVIWDIGAIASSMNPDRYILIRNILRASASIPGFFPPVLIDVHSGSTSFAELHVDGGTTSSLLFNPMTVAFHEDTGSESLSGRVVVLYNGALTPVYRTTPARTFEVMRRALTVSLKGADQRSIERLQAFAQNRDLAVEVHAVGPAAEDPEAELFDQTYMRELFEMGQVQGRAR